MRFTKGTTKDAGDDYARVYDRLRKRSQRLAARWEDLFWSFSPSDDELSLEERRRGFYNTAGAADMLHAAYVRGVKDALAALVDIDEDIAVEWSTRAEAAWGGNL